MSRNNVPFATAQEARDYMLGGEGIVTIRSKPSRKYFTYKLKRSPDGRAIFVTVKTRLDRWFYIGCIFEHPRVVFRHKKELYSQPQGPPVSLQAFSWMFDYIVNKRKLSNELEIYHDGICGVCGRTLTNPDSMQRGIGPICMKKQHSNN